MDRSKALPPEPGEAEPIPDVRLWCADTAAIPTGRSVLSDLSPEERQIAGRLEPAARQRFCAGRSLLRQVLGSRLGTDPRSVPIVLESGGKPTLGRGAGPPFFNLSHCEGRVAVALSEAGPVGLDIERLSRALDTAALAPSVLTEAERAALARAPDRNAGFLALWTAKEAAAKAGGLGIRTDPKRIRILLPDDFLRTGSGLAADADGKRWRLARFAWSGGVIGAAAMTAEMKMAGDVSRHSPLVLMIAGGPPGHRQDLA